MKNADDAEVVNDHALLDTTYWCDAHEAVVAYDQMRSYVIRHANALEIHELRVAHSLPVKMVNSFHPYLLYTVVPASCR